MKEENLKKSSLDQLNQIHSMMEQSTRFISLSGLSGILAGITALIGAGYAYLIISKAATVENPYMMRLSMHTIKPQTIRELVVVGAVMLIVAISIGILLTLKKAKKKGQNMWGKTSQRLLLNLTMPLVAGGIFSLILIHHGLVGLIAPVTLLFYGLALLNASKYTLHDIRYLGICEIILGLIGSYFIGYGLLIWAIGFGLLHIVYGGAMYLKYDRDD
jgi:predicted lysophospholipase L1 biosynthesis ABC-type transport system permease subunit